ncbi:MAG TPA: pilus assembly protein PilP [Candidatus Acidoferrales bacterium]|nr:pilus assembly protein PilP [Candidatus Acidoferrales bacterium]
MIRRSGCHSLIWVVLSLSVAVQAIAQEEEKTPAHKTKEALEKFSKFPSAVGERLKSARDKVKNVLQDALGAPPAKKAEPDGLDVPKRPEKTESPQYSPLGKRDPFAPAPSRREVRQVKRGLTPLEQFEIGQLKLVGIVWDSKEPRAIVEDASGLGYIIKVGTPIGPNGGKVKAIAPDEVVIQEYYVDFYGARKSRDFSMKLPSE